MTRRWTLVFTCLVVQLLSWFTFELVATELYEHALDLRLNEVEGNVVSFEGGLYLPGIENGERRSVSVTTGSMWIDYDLDGDLDLFIITYSGINRLFRNDGIRNFVPAPHSDLTTDIGSTSSAAWADVDKDGDLDVIVTSAGEKNTLYLQKDGGMFDRVSDPSWGDIVSDVCFKYIRENDSVVQSSGCDSRKALMTDINADGWVDILVINSLDQLNQLFMHKPGENAFELVVPEQGDAFVNSREETFDAEILDFNHDGLADVFITGGYGFPTELFVYFNGSYQQQETFSGLEGHTDKFFTEIVKADLNVDGLDDILISSAIGYHSLLLQMPNGSFVEDMGFSAANEHLASTGRTSSPATGDLDGDGYPEVLIATLNDSPNLLYHNLNGSGWELLVDHSLATVLESVPFTTIVDVDSDGLLDVHYMPSSRNVDESSALLRPLESYFFINQGNMAFSTDSSDFGRAQYPYSYTNRPCVADVDGDGSLDIVEPLWGFAKPFSLYLNDGNGAYSKVEYRFVSDQGGEEVMLWFVSAVQCSDIEGDGVQDIFVGGWGSPAARMSYDPVAATVSVVSYFPDLVEISEILNCDLNRDEHDDILWIRPRLPFVLMLTHESHGNVTLHVHGNDTHHEFEEYGTGATSAVCGDVNGDGYLDVFVTTASDKEALPNILFQNIDGKHIHKLEYEAGTIRSKSTSAAFHDYDQDGDLDLFVTNTDSEPNVLLENIDGHGNFRVVEVDGITESRQTSWSCVWADFNLDDRDDLVVFNANGEHDVFLNHGEGTLVPLQSHSVCGTGAFKWAAAADLDGDGDPDVIAARVVDDGDIFRSILTFQNVLELEPVRLIDSIALPPIPTHAMITTFVVEDVTGDGNVDVVLGVGAYAASIDGGVFVLEWQEDGKFALLNHSDLVVEGSNIIDISSQDIDGDGDVDIYVSSMDVFIPDRRKNHVFLNDGDGRYHSLVRGHPILGDDEMSSQMTMWHDWDGDGNVDLFLTNVRGKMQLFRNHGSLNFTLVNGPWEVLPPMFPRGGIVYDFDADGIDDFLLVTSIETPNFLFKHHGGFVFSLPQSIFMATQSSAVDAMMVDFDFDGDEDVIVSTVKLNSDYTRDSEANLFYRNDGNGNWVPVTDVLTGGDDRQTNRILYEDFNGDGMKDIFFGNGDIFVLRGERDDLFLSERIERENTTSYRLAASRSTMVQGVSMTTVAAVVENNGHKFLLLDRNGRSVDVYHIVSCGLNKNEVCLSCPPGTFGVKGRCISCPKGTYSNQFGSTSCVPCEPGPFYQDEPGQTDCKVCPTGLYVRNAGSTSREQCTVCPRGTDLDVEPLPYHSCPCLPSFYRFSRMGECFSCPQDGSAHCFGDSLEPSTGYWWNRSLIENEISAPAEILECPIPNSCRGGVNSTCEDGYTGEACTLCLRGYYFSYGQCTQCPSKAAAVSLFVAVIIVCVAVLYWLARSNLRLAYSEVRRVVSDMDEYYCRNREHRLDGMTPEMEKEELEMVRKIIMRDASKSSSIISAFSQLKIFVAFYQESTIVFNAFQNILPHKYVEWAEKFDIINLEIFSIGSPTCIWSDINFDYFSSFAGTFGVFLVLVVIAFGTWSVRRIKQWYFKVPRVGFVHPDSKRSWQSYYAYSIACLRWTLFVVYIVYIPVSVRIFSVFRCQLVGDDYYLKEDYSISCSSDRYMQYQWLSIFLAISFCLGVPAIFFFFLRLRSRVVSHCMDEYLVVKGGAQLKRREPIRIRLRASHQGEETGLRTFNRVGRICDLDTRRTSMQGQSVASIVSCFPETVQNPSRLLEEAQVGETSAPYDFPSETYVVSEDATSTAEFRGRIPLNAVFEGPSGELTPTVLSEEMTLSPARSGSTSDTARRHSGTASTFSVHTGSADSQESQEYSTSSSEDKCGASIAISMPPMRPSRLALRHMSLTVLPSDIASSAVHSRGLSTQSLGGGRKRPRPKLRRDEGQVLLFDEHMFNASMVTLATSFLHENYRPGAYYWEVFEILRRLLMTSVAIHLGSNVEGNLFSGVMVCLVSISVLQLWQPYRRKRDFLLMRMALLSLFSILWISYGLKTGALSDSLFVSIMYILSFTSVGVGLLFMLFQALRNIYRSRIKPERVSSDNRFVSAMMIALAMFKFLDPRKIARHARVFAEEGLDGLA